MNTSTNVQTTALAAGVTTVLLWLLGFFAPDLMAAAPTGLEAAITGIVAVAAGYLLPKEKLEKGTGDG